VDKRYASVSRALDGVLRDGMTLMVGGFGLVGVPENLVREVVRSGVKDLTVISSNMGVADGGAGVLLEGGQVSRVISSFSGGNKLFERLVIEGAVTWEIVPQGTLFERIRAGGAGIGGFYTPTGVGTDIARGREVRTIRGREYLFEEPLRADLALIKGWRGDPYGNLVYRKTARNGNPVMATAADVVVAEVEEIVDLGDLDPDAIHTPCIYVHRLVLGEHYQKRIEYRTVRPREARLDEPEEDSPMRTKELVLLADPRDDRLVTRLSLEHDGYGVEVCNTIEAARRRIAEAHPDAVLIECQGRCHEALALMRDLRADPATADTVVVALTACPGLDADCKAIEAGCDRVMHKERALDVPQELQLLLRGPCGQ